MKSKKLLFIFMLFFATAFALFISNRGLIIALEGDTDWQSNYEYSLANDQIILTKYIGENVNAIMVPNVAIIDGNSYSTVLNGSVFGGNKTITSVSFASGCTAFDVSNLFENCWKLKSVDVSGLNTAGITNMSGMFTHCHELEDIVFGNFNTSSCTNMSNMFSYCKAIKKINLSSFNTENVTTFGSMFNSCEKLKELDLSSFKTPKLTYMGYMFGNCTELESIDLSTFDTSKVKVMEGTFRFCQSLQSLDLSSFSTDSLESLSGTFSNCYKLTSLDLSNFDTSNVTTFWATFSNDSALQVLKIPNFDTTNATTKYFMFNGTTNLKMLEVGSSTNLKDTELSNKWKLVGNEEVQYDPYIDMTDADTANNVFDGNDIAAGIYMTPTRSRVSIIFDGVEDSQLPSTLSASFADNYSNSRSVIINKPNYTADFYAPSMTIDGKLRKFAFELSDIPLGFEVIETSTSNNATTIKLRQSGQNIETVHVKITSKYFYDEQIEGSRKFPSFNVFEVDDIGNTIGTPVLTLQPNKPDGLPHTYYDDGYAPKYSSLDANENAKYKIFVIDDNEFSSLRNEGYDFVEENMPSDTDTLKCFLVHYLYNPGTEHPGSDERINISVEKRWLGAKGLEAKINLLANGDKVDDIILNEQNEWKHVFSNLPKYMPDSDNEIEYSLKEDDISGYISNISGSPAQGFVVTNSYNEAADRPINPSDEVPRNNSFSDDDGAAMISGGSEKKQNGGYSESAGTHNPKTNDQYLYYWTLLICCTISLAIVFLVLLKDKKLQNN